MAQRREFEFIDYPTLTDVKLFLVDIHYRNMHMHKEFELFEVMRGRMEIFCQSSSHVLSAGDFCLLNPRQAHEIHALSQEPVRIMPLQVSPNFWARYYPQISNVEFDCLYLNPYLGDSLAELRRRYLLVGRAYLLREPYYELSCSSEINQIMRILLKHLPWHYLTQTEKEAKKGHSSRISRIMAYIEAHFTEKLLLRDLCEQEGLSLHYMSHYFTKHFGMSFQEYLNLLRFQRAKLLAERSDMKLTDIALSSGFSDTRYLNSAFERYMGCDVQSFRASRSAQEPPRAELSGSADQRFLDERETRAFLAEYGDIPANPSK